MVHYLAYATEAGTTEPRGMLAQVRQMLKASLWCVPTTALLRMRLEPGDGLLVAVGSPYRVFVGDAVVASRYHRFTEEEAAHLPAALHFDHGITLRRARLWPRPLEIMAVWPSTTAYRKNQNRRALFFGAITALSSVDAAIIIAAGKSRGQPRSEAAAASDAGASAAAGSLGQQGHSVAHGAVVAAAPALPTDPLTGVRGLRDVRSPATFDHAVRAREAAAMSPPWLPARIAHADWGIAPEKCIVATAELDDGAYHAHVPRTVAGAGGLLERMHLDYLPLPGLTALLGFDFPIGIPEAYARGAGVGDFADWFRRLDLESPFFDVAADLAEVSTDRPFFPRLITVKTPGIKERYRQALGLTAAEALRRTDRAHCARLAASEMFWTLGPKAVGKATLAGWKHALRPALAEPGRRYTIWPYDGGMSELLESSDAIIVETYPAEAYRQLGLRMGSPGTAKTRQADRLEDARRILDWCADNAVIPDDELLAELLQGFGSGEAGEDRFDAVVGLLAMIDTVRRRAEPELPDDPAVRRLEGWIFGQHAICPDEGLSRANATRGATHTAATPSARQRMSDEERDRILALLEQDLPSAEIAWRLGTPVARVIAVKANRTMGAYAGEGSTTGSQPLGDTPLTLQPIPAQVQPPEYSDGTADDELHVPVSQLHQSDSTIQRNAETAILASVAKHFGAPIAPSTLKLPSGARVEVDGVTTDLSILVEVFAHQGALKGGQQKKVCQDALKLITLSRSLPDAKLILAFADERAAAYATKGTWVAEALAAWGVKVLVVDVGEELRADIRRAQLRQVMVNPALAQDDPDL